MDDRLKKFRPVAPSDELRKRILAEAADAPFVARLQKTRPQGPRPDLGMRILSAARARVRRRIVIGRWLRSAAAALIALSVPVNAWINGNNRAFLPPNFAPNDSGIEDPILRSLPIHALRMKIPAQPAVSLEQLLALRDQWRKEWSL